MSEHDNEQNKYFLGGALKDKISSPSSINPKTKGIIAGVIVFLICTVLYGLNAQTASVFYGIDHSFSLFGSLGRMLKESKVITLLVVALSYITYKIVYSMCGGSKKQTIKEDERGHNVVQNAAAARSELMGEAEFRDTFTLAPISKPYQVILGKHDNKIVCLPFERTDFVNGISNTHMLIAGPSGAGKTSGILLPNIAQRILAGHSQIVLDPKGEIYSTLSPLAYKYMDKVYILNTNEEELGNSDGWDCTSFIKTAKMPTTKAKSFADCILQNASSAGKDFWNQANLNALTLLLLFVTRAKGFVPNKSVVKPSDDGSVEVPSSARTLEEVLYYTRDVNTLISAIDKAILTYQEDEELLGQYFALFKTNTQKEQILSGLGIALSIFNDSIVKKILSSNEIDIDDLVNKKTIIFIIAEPMKDTFAPVLSLFINSAIDRCVSLAHNFPKVKLPRPLYITLEEFGSICKIPNLKRVLNTARSYNIGICICVQTITDIESLYGNDKVDSLGWIAIIDNIPLQICLGGNYVHSGSGMSNAAYFSAKAGRQVVTVESEMENRDKRLPEKLQKYLVMEKKKTTSQQTVNVLNPDDILHLKGDKLLVIAGPHNAKIMDKYQYREHPMSTIRRVDKYGNEAEPMPAQHIPKWQGGDGSLWDESEYEVQDIRYYENAANGRIGGQMSHSSGHSFADFL